MKIQTKETVSALSADQASAPAIPRSIDAARGELDPESPNGETATLDKVRELLFGEQVRETGARLRDQEERLFDETRRVQGELSERMDNLDRDLDAKLDRLGRQLATLEGRLQESNETTSERINAFRDELAQRMADGTRALDSRITENHEQAIAHIEKAAGDLEEAKMGREALAAFLSEMALRVSGK
jgi:DNA anti-recombination protein RmuC